MLAIVIIYGKYLTQFLARSRNVTHEPRPPTSAFSSGLTRLFAWLPSIHSHPCSPALDQNTWLGAFEWSENRLLLSKDIKDPLTSKMSSEEQNTLLFDIYSQEEKLSQFVPRLCSSFQLRARCNPSFFFVLFFRERIINSYQGAQELEAVKAGFLHGTYERYYFEC